VAEEIEEREEQDEGRVPVGSGAPSDAPIDGGAQ